MAFDMKKNLTRPSRSCEFCSIVKIRGDNIIFPSIFRRYRTPANWLGSLEYKRSFLTHPGFMTTADEMFHLLPLDIPDETTHWGEFRARVFGETIPLVAAKKWLWARMRSLYEPAAAQNLRASLIFSI